MNESLCNFSSVYRKGTRHLETVSYLLQAYPVALDHACIKAPNPGVKAEELIQAAFRQAKSLVEYTAGIANVIHS